MPTSLTPCVTSRAWWARPPMRCARPLDAAGFLDPLAEEAAPSRPTLAMWSQDDPIPPDPAAPAAVRPTVAPEGWAQRYDDRGPIGMGAWARSAGSTTASCAGRWP